MSVASKTKTKMLSAVTFGFVVVSVALPTWANTIPEAVSVFPASSIVVSTSGQQDLSVLRAKLKERFSGVAEEAGGLLSSLHGSSSAVDDDAVRVLDVRPGMEGVAPLIGQNYFIDIGNDPYASYINRLAAYGVLTSHQKFYPQNYFRVEDFAALFAKLYQKTSKQSLNLDDIVGMDVKDGIMTKGMLQQLLFATKDLTMVTIDGEPYDKLMRSEGAYYLVRIFDVPVLSVASSVSYLSSFSDMSGHPSANAVATLASLGIVSTTAPKFYPDNYLRHYDFVLLLVNSLLVANNQTLTPSLYSPFADVESSASYLSQLTYARDHGFVDSLIGTKGGQFYFAPNDFVTKDQVYTILSKILPVSFVYDKQLAGTQKISRGELANLLVESFQFEAKNRETDSSSLTGVGTGDLSLLNKVKVLLSLLG